jgi:hypothetical protein
MQIECGFSSSILWPFRAVALGVWPYEDADSRLPVHSLQGMPIDKVEPSTARFLNVDLEVKSRMDLQQLATALAKKASVLYIGRIRRTYHAHFELVRLTKTPAATIRGFCALIDALPRPAREVWDAAHFRDFNIGVQAGTLFQPTEFSLDTRTLNASCELGARIVLTVYGSPESPKKLKQRAPARHSDKS